MSILDDARTVANKAWRGWGLPPADAYPAEERVTLEERALAVQEEVLRSALSGVADPQERAARHREILTEPLIAGLESYAYGLLVGSDELARAVEERDAALRERDALRRQASLLGALALAGERVGRRLVSPLGFSLLLALWAALGALWAGR